MHQMQGLSHFLVARPVVAEKVSGTLSVRCTNKVPDTFSSHILTMPEEITLIEQAATSKVA
jgi:hypothetical protein